MKIKTSKSICREDMGDYILEVEHLTKTFDTPRGPLLAVDDVSFNLERGKILGVVGESGSGKSTVGRMLVNLIRPTSGSVIFDKVDMATLSARQRRGRTRDIQMIFQDPFSSLDPRMTVHQLIEEPILQHRLIPDKAEREARVLDLMDTVGIARRLYYSFPHELDGGRRQRIGIARALATNPKFIVCDEPVSALDVSIQAQIINLLEDLKEQFSLSYVFITHDLSVIYYLADEILVMYMGRIVEKASSDELFANPLHPYTQALLSAIPSIDLNEKKNRIVLKGEIKSPINLPAECRFSGRCRHCHDTCRNVIPALKEVSLGHYVACTLFD